VFFIDENAAKLWSTQEVLERWHQLFKGTLLTQQPILLTRLNISPDNWLTLTKGFRKLFHGANGRQAALTDYCQNQHLKRRQNLRCCESY
jgi:hypothetical protein